MVSRFQEGPLESPTLSDKMTTGCKKAGWREQEGNYSSQDLREVLYVWVDTECRWKKEHEICTIFQLFPSLPLLAVSPWRQLPRQEMFTCMSVSHVYHYKELVLATHIHT